jgi:D-3-phosphoglycerate dehydrogenase
MSPFRLALVDFDGRPLPEWIERELQEAGIQFIARECRTPADLVEHAGEADALWLFGSRVITAEGLADLPRCGAIIRTGSGTDNVPVAEATRRGIVVANTPEAHSDAVSDHAIGLLFAVLRQVAAGDLALRRGAWEPGKVLPGWHLHGNTLGLIGFGHAARLVARKMLPFGLTVLAYDPFVPAHVIESAGVWAAGLNELLSQSDFVSLHCPLTAGTFHLIGEAQLRRMKPRAILVNTARGAVIDEPALVRALAEGWIAGAGLDVLEQEHADPQNPLFQMDNVVITPHLAGASDEHETLCWRLAVDSAVALANGRWPRSVVNRDSVEPRWPLA